jgi:hypothetical protein
MIDKPAPVPKLTLFFVFTILITAAVISNWSNLGFA